MILFETTTSVFELLWDIALAIFIIRLSLLYTFLAFSTGCLIASYRLFHLQPLHHLTQPQSELITLPFFFITNALLARWLVSHYEIPRVAGFRLAIGTLSLFFMLVAELASGIYLYEKGYTEWIWETDLAAASLGAVTLVLFGLFPALLMLFEGETDEMGETYHGHEKKSVTSAVPKVEITKRKEE